MSFLCAGYVLLVAVVVVAVVVDLVTGWCDLGVDLGEGAVASMGGMNTMSRDNNN